MSEPDRMEQELPRGDETYRIVPLTARFLSADIEQAYRTAQLDQDRALSISIIVCAAVISLAFTIVDSMTVADFSTIQQLNLLSLLFAFYSLGIVAAIHTIRRSRAFNSAICCWWLAAITVVTVSNISYPPGMTIHTTFDILVPVAIYLLFPIGLYLQSSLAILFTLANIYVFTTVKTDIALTEIGFIIIAYISAHIVGVISCYQLHLHRRQRYREHAMETELKKLLQSTLEEIRTLRGIIPICAHCKQIRDDDGYWQEVETYIRKHSEADFTHGICPSCLQEHYPVEFERIRLEETGKEKT